MCGSRGGGDRGSGPSGNYKNIEFFSSTGLNPLKITKIQCWAIMGPPAKRHLNGVSLAGLSWSAKSGIWIIPPLSKLKKKIKGCQSWTPLTKLFGSAHVVCLLWLCVSAAV